MTVIRRYLLAVGCLLAAACAHAQHIPVDQVMPAPKGPLAFAWGAGMNGSVDMSGNDMSNIGMDLYGGIRTLGVQMLGLGVSVDVPVSNSMRSIPVYMIARSNFANRPTLAFAELRCGMSINDLPSGKKQTGQYLSCGAGVNLARGRKYSSHLILAYTLVGRRDYETDELVTPMPDLHMVTLRLGITF